MNLWILIPGIFLLGVALGGMLEARFKISKRGISKEQPK